ncbi:hypothetical protein [Paludisphaera soli]|uniref:hypothetical protein n=1 Tax=Paludisphaera soli TaxID=2712865 RepID=UPI0013EB376E|nr:hypothetical protein [Paludisphaera soli]
MPLSQKKRFARNLDKLLAARNLTRKEAAEWAQVPYQWLRRAVTEGISRPETRNIAHLKALADRLGLSSPDRFWDRSLYVEPIPDSIEDEADRLAELMRKYVTLVGPDDGLVCAIRSRLWSGVHHEELRKRQLDAMRREVEREDASRKSELRDLDDSKTRWRRYREAIGRATAGRDSEREDRRRDFEATAEGTGPADSLIKLFESEFVEVWKAIGLPRVEEVRIDAWTVAAHASAAKGADASVVSNLWIAEYARLLDETVEGAKDSIRRFVQRAYRIEEDLVVPRGGGESLLRDGGGTVVEEQASTQGQASSTDAPHVEIPAIVHEALDRIRRSVKTRFREAGLVRTEEVTVTPEEVVARPELLAEAEARTLCGRIMNLVWVPKYAAIVGLPLEQAFDLVSRRLNEADIAAGARATGVGEASDHGPVADVRSQEQHPDSKLVETPPEIDSTPAVETPEQKEHRRCEERRRVAGQEAAALVAKVFAALDLEQSSLIHRIYGSRSQAESWVQAELYYELIRLEHVDLVSPPAVLDQAVDFVAGQLMEDVETHLAPSKADVPRRHEIDEQVAADERPLELRRRVEHLDDEDLGSPPGPIGTALQDLITGCVADDLSKYEERADDVLELLADTPSSSAPRLTYRAVLRRIGDPKSLAEAALRNCDGDVSKALDRIVRQVDDWVQDEKARASAGRRSEPAAPDDRTTPPPRRKKSGVVPLKLIRKDVLGLHRRGADRQEILEALTNDPYLPDHVRRAPPGRLEEAIEQILARVAGDDDDWTRDYQDFSSDQEEDNR